MKARRPPYAMSHGAGTPGLQRALDECRKLLMQVEAFATMLAELGDIELPPAARTEPMQMRAVASLYLASTLEAAGLIDVADDFVRMVRSGVIRGDLGSASELVKSFWANRTNRIEASERFALFSRLFGTPGGPVDSRDGANHAFDERLLDLCDAIMSAASQGSQAKVRSAGLRLAENVAEAVNDTVLMMAREIINDLGTAVNLLGHADVRAAMNARTLWDVVASIDRRMRRARRPTLSYLRRGRAGMTVLAWLADVLDRIEGGGTILADEAPVVAAAVDWVDETLNLVEAEPSAQEATGAGQVQAGGDKASWQDLGL